MTTTTTLFETIHLVEDEPGRSAAMNMAVDETLLESATKPMLRVYRWDHPALSFGYFGRYEDVAGENRDLVRRWTGGGIVFHGEDLTYGLVIPAGDPLFAESSAAIYERTHRALQNALQSFGTSAELSSVAAVYDRRMPRSDKTAAVMDRRDRRDECFAKPVRADVLIDGRKIAGAAQRRTRAGLLQQGSIQQVQLAPGFIQCFARAMAGNVITGSINHSAFDRARGIAAEKYATEAWLRRR